MKCDKGVPIFLTVLVFVLMLIPVGTGNMFGSEGDWYSQHVAAAENIRQTILDSGTIFPQFSAAGGGCSIYDYAYYGLLRPDVLLSCLIPSVEMKYVISIYSIAGVAAAVNLCYRWLRQEMDVKTALTASVLLAAAACWYQSHHQIMFVNYMPFLLASLISIDKIVQRDDAARAKGITGLIISLFMIYLHSFYYSISCLAVCTVYLIYKLEKLSNEQRLRVAAKSMLSAVLAGGMAAVLLLPTFLDILSTSKDGGSFAEESLGLVDLSMEGLLYNPYGCGLTMIALYAIFMGIRRKPTRILSVLILAAMAVPAVSLVLNGFLYARAKILIPFLPLVVLLVGQMLKELSLRNEKPSWACAFLCAVPVIFSDGAAQMAGIVDLVLLIVWVWAGRMAYGGRKTFALNMTGAAVSLLIFLLPVGTSLAVNFSDDYVSLSDQRQERFTDEEIKSVVTDERYRFEILSNNFVNCNRLAGSQVGRTSMYSSITDAGYSEFYYEILDNPISIRQRVALLPSENPVFTYFMGVRYVMTAAENIPDGYEILLEKDGYAIAECNDTLPVFYGSCSLMDENQFKKLNSAKKYEALCTGTVVKNGEAKQFQSHVEEAEVEMLSDSRLEPGSYALALNRKLQDEILIIEFDVKSPSGKQVEITIEGMKNVLSAKTAAYPNHNDRFTYVLPSAAKMEKIQVNASEGDWYIENAQVYTLNKKYLRNHEIYEVTSCSEAEKDGTTIFCGSVNMAERGYFVTSCPYRRGYEITVDEEKIEYEEVNTTFVGFPLDEGIHEIEIRYTAPGFTAGLGISVLSLCLTVTVCIIERKKAMKQLYNSQIFRYVVTGGITTAVNYVIYFAMAAAGIHYLAANSAAWVGAVIFAFFANRKIVFNSRGNKTYEFISFFGVRLVTLLAENGLLFLLIDCMGALDTLSKIAVSVITVVLNYGACKYGVFKEGGVCRG